MQERTINRALSPSDRGDGVRAGGPPTLPGLTGPAGPTHHAAALHAHVCGPTAEAPAPAALRGLPQVHRGAVR